MHDNLEVVNYAEKHSNSAAAKHYDIDESNIRYWCKQNLVLAAIPTTIKIAADDESVPEDIASFIASDKETLPDELFDTINEIGFSSE